ncbi:MAG: hypothetical protein MK207_13300 [Saprospiraceae bacterium]|nr:hypothetical protein [Saprospiraceae bacterium]
MKLNIQVFNYFFFALFILLIFDACSNPFEDQTLKTQYPDTTVAINSLVPQKCDVTIKSTDSTYHISAYWTDKLTGRIIYKMDDEPYKNSRLHGVQYKYDEDGDTLLIAHFENGVRIDSTVYRWENGNPKHKYFYSPAKDGNIMFEIQFHENGQPKTDLVAYEKGLINGAVNYYSDSPNRELTETFYYREGELIGIKIYNKNYSELDIRTAAMMEAYKEDSTRIANALLADASPDGLGVEIPVFYIGTEKDGMYDIGDPDDWDIMKVDPAYMLKYYNR